MYRYHRWWRQMKLHGALFCWQQNREGEPENVVLGSFEKWRGHMHEQHFDKLGRHYASDEIMPCYWCCRPCVTKKGQNKPGNSLAFWGSHERVCRENPNKPAGFRDSQGARSVIAESSHSCSSGARAVSSPFAESREVRHLREFRGSGLQRGLDGGSGVGIDRGTFGGQNKRSHLDESNSPQSIRHARSTYDRGFNQANGSVPRGGSGYQPRSPVQAGGRQREEADLPRNAPRNLAKDMQDDFQRGTTLEEARGGNAVASQMQTKVPPPSVTGGSRAPARRAL